MQLDKKRWAFLLDVFTKGPGLTRGELASEAGVSNGVLTPAYASSYRAGTQERLLTAAARKLNVDESQLAAWLSGEPEPALQAYLAGLIDLRECTRCKDWVDVDEMVISASLCKPCVRASQSPHSAGWQQAVSALMNSCRDKILVAAWTEVVADTAHAVTDVRLARAAGLTIGDFRKRWADAGLPRKRGFDPTRPTSIFIHTFSRRGDRRFLPVLHRRLFRAVAS